MSEKKKRALCHGSQFCAGGTAYGLLEIGWRGYTHISMIILGGICFCFLIAISRTKLRFSLQCMIGALFISAGEFLTGCIVNLWLKLNVWDYSQESMQLCGQICMRYFILWYVLSVLVILACRQWMEAVYRRTGSREAALPVAASPPVTARHIN